MVSLTRALAMAFTSVHAIISACYSQVRSLDCLGAGSREKKMEVHRCMFVTL